jgi:hypothetical protein
VYQVLLRQKSEWDQDVLELLIFFSTVRRNGALLGVPYASGTWKV